MNLTLRLAKRQVSLSALTAPTTGGKGRWGSVLNALGILRVLLFSLVLLSGCDSRHSQSDSGRASRDGESERGRGPNGVESAEGVEGNAATRSNGLDGRTILQQVVGRYASAKSYSDKAVLYLNYRMDGRPIQEPHPFSTSWDSAGRLSSRIFNSHLQCDGQRLSCFVFDNDTGNLDNQQLFLKAEGRVPLTALYQDSIVRHFVGGYNDLPLDESDKVLPPKLIPPPLSMLTRQLPWGWLQTPDTVQRQADQTIDHHLCYVVRSLFNESTADIWIDQQTLLLVQVSVPLRVMARSVLIAGEIQDVQLMMKFHEAAVDQSVRDENHLETHSAQRRGDATPVRRYVSIPDAFPCELIGKTAPHFELVRSDGQTINRLFFDGKSTALLWIGGETSVQQVQQFVSATREFSEKEFCLGLVFSESQLADPESSSLEMTKELQAIAESTRVPFFFDSQLQTSTRLKITTLPIVILLNGDSGVEFARSASDGKWSNDFTAALKRVQRGEDVAAEMHAQYVSFLEEYHQQLVAVSAASLVGVHSVSARRPGAGASGNASAAQTNATSKKGTADAPSGSKRISVATRLNPRLVWTNRQFQRAGNLQVVKSKTVSQLFAFDGWRTVVELDLSTGRTLARHELDLPEQSSVSCLRVVPDSFRGDSKANDGEDGDVAYAVFNVQGDRVFLFDREWQPVATLPDSSFQHQGIRDLQFVGDSVSGALKAVVSFGNDNSEDGGTYRFDLKERTTKRISSIGARALAVVDGELVFCNANQFGAFGGGRATEPAPGDLKFRHLIGMETPTTAAVCVTASDSENNWYLGGIGEGGKLKWRQPVGSLLFENEIEPMVAYVLKNGPIVIATADAGNQVSFMTEQGVFLGQFQLPGDCGGIELQETDKGLQLLVSTTDGVQAYDLDFGL